MTELVITLPDDLAERARKQGLLTDEAIRELLEQAVRRAAGRKLLEIAKRLQAASLPPMSEEEIVQLVREVRAERRARTSAGASGADRS
ncbi:MAG TPA: hypothetical protein VLV56_07285 [Burkholderiales bacterium]|nr:hypothetical protein [Burkholderiales bacterium]